jgi:hypothetical protein
MEVGSFSLLDVGGQGITLNTGVIGISGDLQVSTITAVSTINGEPYFPIYNGLATIPGNNTLSNYYIALPTIPGFTSNAVVQALLQEPDDVTNNWIVYANPVSTATANYIGLSFAQNVSVPTTAVSWSIGNANATPTIATTTAP